MQKDLDDILASNTEWLHKQCEVAASVGIAEQRIDSDFNLEEIMQKADAQMYKNKQKRKREN